MSVDGEIELVPSITDKEIPEVRVNVTDTLTHALSLKAALDERVRRGEALTDCTDDDDDRDWLPLTDISADFEELRVDKDDFDSDSEDDDERELDTQLLDDGDKLEVGDWKGDGDKRILLVRKEVVEDETVANEIEFVATALTESQVLIDNIGEIVICGEVLYEIRIDRESIRDTVLRADCDAETDDE